MGNRQDELAWWQQQHRATGYETWSGTIAPGVSTLAFWIAQQILDGQQVPKDVTVPYLTVTQETLDQAVASTPVGGVANKEYTREEAVQAIQNNR
jgi:ribose transport system substrate-binding protein